MVDFLIPRLFEPTGIAYPVWETCPMGNTAGGMGLSLRTEDVAKIGQMLLDNGRFAGKTIVSAEYLAMAVRKQSDNCQCASGIDTAQGTAANFYSAAEAATEATAHSVSYVL
jgi:CubicO group peptidase (beta-lactamase class C family)